MGRYYDGDIEGKFWFGIQASDDGKFFGATEQESYYINYYLEKEDFINSKGLKRCKENLIWKYKKRKINLLTLSKEHDKYINDLMKSKEKKDYTKHYQLGEYLDKIKNIQLTEEENYTMLTWLARYSMGMKMKEYFDNNPEDDALTFEAES